MTEQSNLVPKRRFKEFQYACAWKQRKFNELIDKLTGGASIKPDDYQERGVRTIPKGAVNSSGVADLSGSKYITHVFFEKNISSKVSTSDLVTSLRDLVPTAPNMGRIVRVKGKKEDFLMPQGVYRIELQNDVDEDFMIAFSNCDKYRKIISAEKNGSTQVHIRNGKFLNIEIKTPNYEEQKKIGKFFKQLDSTIALHQRKLEKTKALKSAYLSEMFPAEGEREPRRRFAGFTCTWEQRKLGEVADIIGGGTPSTSNEEYWDGDIDWYSPVEIGEKTYVYSSQKKITELGLQKSSARILPIGTVLFTSRAGIGNTAILAKEGATNQGFQSIVPHKDELDSYFIYSRTHELKRYGETNGAGSTFLEVSGKQMAKMPILIPTLEEQKKIGSFFKELDHLIALHQRKLENLQNIKKAYLNEMFV